MRRLLLFTAVLVMVSAAFAVAAAADQRTKNGSFVITVQAVPPEPVVGSNSATLTIKDASSGAAVEGATVKVVPWMTVHGHGSPKNARVTEKGSGVYEVNDLYYSMRGAWDLLISIKQGGVEDSASVAVDIKK